MIEAIRRLFSRRRHKKVAPTATPRLRTPEEVTEAYIRMREAELYTVKRARECGLLLPEIHPNLQLDPCWFVEREGPPA